MSSVLVKEYKKMNKFTSIEKISDYSGHELFKVIEGHIVDADKDLARIDKCNRYISLNSAMGCFYRYKREIDKKRKDNHD